MSAPEIQATAGTDTAAVFRALGDPVRLRLFTAIAGTEELCVCDMPEVGVSLPTVSHHLRKLRESGLIVSERRGTWVYYEVTDLGRRASAAVTTFEA